MAYDLNELTRLKHLVELGDQILDVTDALDVRVTTLEEGSGSGGSGTIYCNTTNYWAQHPTFIPNKGAIVIYSDHAIVDDRNIPAFKVGDGLAYAVDLPFSGDDIRAVLTAHIADNNRHLTEQDRDKLENSVSVSVSGTNLIFQ